MYLEEKDVGCMIVFFPFFFLRLSTEGGAWTQLQAPGCVGTSACLL